MRTKKISRVLASLVLCAITGVQAFPLFVFAEDVVVAQPTPPAEVVEIAPSEASPESVIIPPTAPDAPGSVNESDPVIEESSESAILTEEALAEDEVLEDDAVALPTEEVVDEEDSLHNLPVTTFLSSATSTSNTLEEFVLGGSIGTTTSTTTVAVGGTGSDGVDGRVASSTPTIVSGQAVAMANILNIVNTNLINSTGHVVFLNLLENEENAIDFRDYFNGTQTGVCELLSCGENEGVQVNLINDAYIENQIRLNASSGDNQIEGGDSAIIETGNAYAGLNLVNVVNTNFIDSNYLLVTLNAFNGISGDIVFPNLEKFFASLGGTSTTAPYLMDLSNQADIVNEVETGAESGNNNVEDGQMMTINTGNSVSSSNVFNQINTNLSEDSKVSILFRVHGNWLGEIFGAPQDLIHTQGMNGDFYLTSASSSVSRATELAGSVYATSTARILNDVSVTALTGNNDITGADTALISTGNALAGANLVNIANANVIGRNWIFAIINIFGDFTGNISFGRPDLWVGEQIVAPSVVENDAVLTYKFTVINNGDSRATEVTLRDKFDASHLDVLESSLPYVIDGENLVWNIGTLPSGGAIEITYKAKIKNTSYSTHITNVVTAILRETDNNALDNTDTATVMTRSAPSGGGGGVSVYQPLATQNDSVLVNTTDVLQFTVIRETVSGTIGTTSPRSIMQKIVVRNPESRDIPKVTLHDILRDPSQNILRAEYFNLGTVLAHEEIVIEYEILFGEEAVPGDYKLFTVINSGRRNMVFESNGSITLLGDPIIPVLPVLPQIASSTLALARDKQSTLGASFKEDKDVIEPVSESYPEELLTDAVGLRTVYAEQNNLTAATSESDASMRQILQMILLIFIVALSLAGLNKIRGILSKKN